MGRGFVLRYLGRVADGASLVEARRALPGVLSLFIRTRARPHVIAAGFETEHADAQAHVHRLAYLRALGIPVLDPNDLEAVSRFFTERRRLDLEGRAGRRTVLTVAGVALVAVAGLAAWAALARPGSDDPEVFNAAAAPITTVKGGEPDGEEGPPEHPLAEVFRSLLPDYVVALDALSSGRERNPPADVASRRREVLAVLKERAPALVEPMTGLFDAAETYVRAEDRRDDQDQWFNKLVLFHDALEEEAVPFYVDAALTFSRRTGRQRLLMSTYTVGARRTWAVGEDRVRSLELTRLDTLNFERSLLGYTRPEVRYALVLVDKIERFLVRDALPSVHAARESVIVRGYEDEVGTEWVTDFEGWAHEDLRAEAEHLVREAGLSTRDLDTLAAAVVQRRNGIATLGHVLRSRGVRLREPEAYDVDTAEIQRVGRDADEGAAQSIAQAQRALASPRVQKAYAALREARSLSIAEHEVQHRLDYEADLLVAVPEVLSQHTGETLSEDRVNRRAESANAELSAYLAQIARRPALARTSLIHVLSFLMNRQMWRKAEAYAALALVEALAREGGIPVGNLAGDRRVARVEVSRIYGEIRKMPPEHISSLAARTWSTLYGRPFAE